MKSSEGLITCVILNLLLTVCARPNCKTSAEGEVVCTAGENDYVLQRGLVSDNDKAIRIVLRNCHIVDVDKDAFRNMDNLKYIDLSQNKISTLKPGILDWNRDVTYLNLSYNMLSTLPKGLFDLKSSLNTLDLKGNKLNSLARGVFDPLLHKLSYLDLSNNSLFGKDMPRSLFDKNHRIKYLDFSRNNMAGTSDLLLESLLRLDFLNLDRCSLNQVPSFATRFNLKTMTHLILSTNQISRISDPGTFAKLDDLEILNLARNVIEEIAADVFKSLYKLKMVVLRNNRLKTVPNELFFNVKTIGNVDLSYNFIEYVPVNAFRGTSLKYLNLSHNRFSYLDADFSLELRNSGAKLIKFYFNDNPWQCACLNDILKEMKTNNIRYNSFKYNGEHVVCVTRKTFVCKRLLSDNAMFIKMFGKNSTM